MQLQKNLKQNKITVTTQSLDDLWTLSKVIEPHDYISGSTQRKIKIGDASTDRNIKVTKKRVNLTIQVEKVEYEPSLEVLRLTGPITDGPEDIPRGEYHSFAVSNDTQITIQKDWLSFQIKKLDEAQDQAHEKTTIVLVDREKALIGTITNQGFSLKKEFTGNVAKKYEGADEKDDFFEKLAIELKHANNVVLATSHFWKDELTKLLKEQGIKNIIHVENDTVSSAQVQHVLSSKEFTNAIKSNIHGQQTQEFEQLLTKINDDLATYGKDEVKRAAESGAAETLFISNTLIQKTRENNTFEELEQILKLADQAKTTIHLIEKESPIEKQLEGLGGIATTLRFQI